MEHDPLLREALAQFASLYDAAHQLQVKQPDAVTLGTCDLSGNPTVRVVLLRSFDECGFVFFTNAESRKGEQLAQNPKAALCFYWDALERQVRVEGHVESTTDVESELYWRNRPRLSQIASCASDQSRPLDTRETFLERIEKLESKFKGREVARPARWHGYRVIPRRIEFWQDRQNRMHERIVYERLDFCWTKYLVYP